MKSRIQRVAQHVVVRGFLFLRSFALLLVVGAAIGVAPCMTVQGQNGFQEDVGDDGDAVEGSANEGRQLATKRMAGTLGVTGHTYKGNRGAFVTEVVEGSKAEQLGLEEGDVIVGVQVRDAWKKRVRTYDDLKRLLSRARGQLRLYVRDCNSGNFVWTPSTSFRGRNSEEVTRGDAESAQAEEDSFSEDDFQGDDDGGVAEPAGAGGEPL